MARGINKVILVGNLGKAPDVRYAPGSTTPITSFSVATSESWKDKNTGERQDRTEWHRVVCFNRLAEITRDYLKQGSKVYIEGSLRTRKWTDKNTNQERYTTEIMASDMQMLDSKGSDSSSPFPTDYDSMSQQMPDNSLESYGHTAPAAAPSNTNASSAPSSKDFDDDIPF